MDGTRHAWVGRLALVATDYRRVGLGRLGALVVGPDAADDLRALRAALGAEELVYLATCNRIECYALLPAAPDDEVLARARGFFAARGAAAEAGSLRLLVGTDAAEHLFQVAASLESLLLGETQIAGQARRAEERARELGLSGRRLQALFASAIAASRRVRAETRLGQVPVSAASIAVHKVKKYFGAEGPRVSLLVGVGEMTVKAAQALAGGQGERIFVNRTRARAEELAARFGGRAMSLDELRAAPPARVDLVFAATAATEVVLAAGVLEPALAARAAEGAPPMVVCDLGLPRDIDPRLDADPRALVIDMGTVESLADRNRSELQVEVDRARTLVAEELERFLREDRWRGLAGESAEHLLARELAHLAGQDQDAILGFALGLAARLARQPHGAAPSR